MNNGTRVFIKSTVDSPYAGEWGIIKGRDNGDYLVALWDGDQQLLFSFNELKPVKAWAEANDFTKKIVNKTIGGNL